MTIQVDPAIVDELRRITSLLNGAQELFISVTETEGHNYSGLGQNMNLNALFILKTALQNLHELSDTLYLAVDKEGAA